MTLQLWHVVLEVLKKFFFLYNLLYRTKYSLIHKKAVTLSDFIYYGSRNRLNDTKLTFEWIIGQMEKSRQNKTLASVLPKLEQNFPRTNPTELQLNWNTLNPRYNGPSMGSVITDVRCNRLKGYSLKYIIGYIANTRTKQRNTHCDYINVFKLRFFVVFKIVF